MVSPPPRSSTSLAVLLLAAGACAQPTPGGSDQALACMPPDGDPAAAELPHGFAAPVPIRYQPAVLPADAMRVVYLNRGPRTYVAGIDDAQAGSSSVVAAQGLKSASLGGWKQGDKGWASTVACVRDQFARFQIAITDVRPVAPGYIEAHFGGDGTEVALHDGSGGIAPIDNSRCQVVDGGVVFVFSDLFGGNLRSICEVGAHEIAHVFSLDHEFRCKDPMTYVQGCGEKAFQPDAAPCGENTERACICARPSQNSVEILRARLGDRRSDVIPPMVELLPPIADPNGAGTYLTVRAHDPDAALAGVELHVFAGGVEQVSRCGDGRLPCTLDGELASFALPAAAVDQRVWAVAEDTSGNRSATAESVVRAGAPLGARLALAVAPLAAAYEASAIVEVQALVIAQAPIARAVVVWTDGLGQTVEVPLCPRDPETGGRYGVAMRLGRGDGPRSFHVRVVDTDGRTAVSQDETVPIR